jgi:hypothetical protein
MERGILSSTRCSPPSAQEPLDQCLQDLTAALDAHLEHEENSALPLIQSERSTEDWRGFAKSMARAQGVKGAAVCVPWIVDGATVAERKRLFSVLRHDSAHQPAAVGAALPRARLWAL